MVKLLLLLLIPFILNSQTLGKTSTEKYKAKFEQEQSIDSVSNYSGAKIPIQLLKIGINSEVYEMYPELKSKRIGLGVTNIILEYLEYTNRFVFTEEKDEIKERMVSQFEASDKGISKNKIDGFGKIKLAKYFVYIEVYDFSVSEDEEVKLIDGIKITQTTRLGLQIKFVDAETNEILVGSGLGEATTTKEAVWSEAMQDIKFNQSNIGTSTKKALETASSRIVSRLIKNGIFKK